MSGRASRLSEGGAAIEPILVNAVDAARSLGISRSQFLALESAGRVPRKTRLGGSVRWSLQELRAWASAGCPSRDRWEDLKAAGLGGAA